MLDVCGRNHRALVLTTHSQQMRRIYTVRLHVHDRFEMLPPALQSCRVVAAFLALFFLSLDSCSAGTSGPSIYKRQDLEMLQLAQVTANCADVPAGGGKLATY